MCGVFGIIGKQQAAKTILQGLMHLQHRGQDGAGLFTYNPHADSHSLHKNRGLVHQVFSPTQFSAPDAHWGIGHLRYATSGSGSIEDVQPHCLHVEGQTIAMAHNGNVVNYPSLLKKMSKEKIAFITTCDTEVILHFFANAIRGTDCTFEDICQAIKKIYSHVFGAYSILVIVAGKGLIAFRDPWGFHPLHYGFSKENESHVFSSETGPLTFLDIANIEDIAPGEVVFVDCHHQVHRRLLTEQQPHTHCSFEFNYFAKPNAVIENQEVYQTRLRLGKTLAQKVLKANLSIDAVVPIPETARPSALALGRELAIPVEEGFIKYDHVGRTFIMPSETTRKKAVLQKISPVFSVFKDKNVLLVDDSIVRGTVSRHVVELARKAGANKVYFASTYPPVRYPCFYGIDFPRQEELIAWEKSCEEICQEIGADRLIYNDVEDITFATQMKDLCTACLTGKYPTSIEGKEELQATRLYHLQQMEESSA